MNFLKRNKKIWGCIALAALLLAGIFFVFPSGKAAPEPLATAEAFVLDTFVQVRIYAADGTVEPQAAADECMELCRGFENIFSMYNKKSSLCLLNEALAGADSPNSGLHDEPGSLESGLPDSDRRGLLTVPCEPQLAEVMDIAKQCTALTYGCFDITVGSVTRLWDFKSESPQPPNAADIAAALNSVGSEYTVSEDGASLTTAAGTVFDLGGIAKGYICGKVAQYLRSSGITSAVIDLGGNIYALGRKPDGSSPAVSGSDGSSAAPSPSSLWSVAVRDPLGTDSDCCCIAYVTDLTVVTSGTYERSFTYDGTFYHHILDPKTGYPAENGIASVTVFSDNTTYADAFSTAFFVMGADGALKTANSLDGTDILIAMNDGSYLMSDGIFDATGLDIGGSEAAGAFTEGKVVIELLH